MMKVCDDQFEFFLLRSATCMRLIFLDYTPALPHILYKLNSAVQGKLYLSVFAQ